MCVQVTIDFANRRAGALLGTVFNAERVLDDEKFFMNVEP